MEERVYVVDERVYVVDERVYVVDVKGGKYVLVIVRARRSSDVLWRDSSNHFFCPPIQVVGFDIFFSFLLFFHSHPVYISFMIFPSIQFCRSQIVQ